MKQSPPRTFRRIGNVIARRLGEAHTWTSRADDVLTGDVGDWVVTDDRGGVRTVKPKEFEDLYEPLPDGTYARRGTVTARQAETTLSIQTLEGTATARPGDWIVTAADGSTWPVPEEVFRAGYEEVDPSP